MSSLSFLIALLHTQANALEFKPGWRIPRIGEGQAHNWHNWLGISQPGLSHAVEIIEHTNARTAPDLLRARLADKAANQPVCVIFCDNLPCPRAFASALQAQAISVLHTPMTAKAVMRSLLASLTDTPDTAQVHGVFLRVHGLGVLLIGQSGTGKSSLALELLERGHALVADDICRFYRMPDTSHIYGVCPPVLYDLLDIDELGVLNIAKVFGPRQSLASQELHIVIELDTQHRPGAAQRLTAAPYAYPLLGTTLPRYKFRLRLAQNLALLVETAVKNQVLYRDGYDANADLAQRQQELMHSV